MHQINGLARELATGMSLVDNHCHSIDLSVFDLEGFEDHLTEAPDRLSAATTPFDSMAGLNLLNLCAPLIGVDGAGPEAYVNARQKIASDELARMHFGRAGVELLLVDTGYKESRLATNDQLAELSGAPVAPILRLETFAEGVLREIARPEDFAVQFGEALRDASIKHSGFKSIAAYRCGLALRGEPVEMAELSTAVAATIEGSSAAEGPRITAEPLVSYLVQTALEVADKPIQFHVGYGDPDLQLDRSNPALLTPFIRMANERRRNIVLLHCYPYHREAAYLAHSFPNVYFDLGLAINFVGTFASRIFSEAMELAPFAKLLYSSDAYALSELHLLGSLGFRSAVADFLSMLYDRRLVDEAYMVRLASMFAKENALRAYRL